MVTKGESLSKEYDETTIWLAVAEPKKCLQEFAMLCAWGYARQSFGVLIGPDDVSVIHLGIPGEPVTFLGGCLEMHNILVCTGGRTAHPVLRTVGTWYIL